MKTKEEIEQLAEKDFKFWQDCGHYELADLKSIDYYYDGFTNGYSQCQEDMAKKYTEEDMTKCWNTAFTDAMNIDSETYKPIFYSDFINSLNKQDK